MKYDNNVTTKKMKSSSDVNRVQLGLGVPSSPPGASDTTPAFCKKGTTVYLSLWLANYGRGLVEQQV
jgi:hypothetical protein